MEDIGSPRPKFYSLKTVKNWIFVPKSWINITLNNVCPTSIIGTKFYSDANVNKEKKIKKVKLCQQ